MGGRGGSAHRRPGLGRALSSASPAPPPPAPSSAHSSHASAHVWSAPGTGSGLPERHTSEPPRLVSSQHTAVPRAILTSVIFINRLTHHPSPHPSPHLAVIWGPSASPEEQRGQRGSHQLRPNRAQTWACPPAAVGVGLPPAPWTQGPPPHVCFLHSLLQATVREHLLHAEVGILQQLLGYLQTGWVFTKLQGDPVPPVSSPRFTEKLAHKHAVDTCATPSASQPTRRQLSQTLEGKGSVMRDASGLSEKLLG